MVSTEVKKTDQASEVENLKDRTDGIYISGGHQQKLPVVFTQRIGALGKLRDAGGLFLSHESIREFLKDEKTNDSSVQNLLMVIWKQFTQHPVPSGVLSLLNIQLKKGRFDRAFGAFKLLAQKKEDWDRRVESVETILSLFKKINSGTLASPGVDLQNFIEKERKVIVEAKLMSEGSSEGVKIFLEAATSKIKATFRVFKIRRELAKEESNQEINEENLKLREVFLTLMRQVQTLEALIDDLKNSDFEIDETLAKLSSLLSHYKKEITSTPLVIDEKSSDSKIKYIGGDLELEYLHRVLSGENPEDVRADLEFTFVDSDGYPDDFD